jgi:hypothetical protein
MTGVSPVGAAVVFTGTTAVVVGPAAVVEAAVEEELAAVVPVPAFLLLPQAATIKATPTIPTPTSFPGVSRA